MSKTDASLGPLVGTLTFDLPAKSTRTLSATQTYDTSRSQLVLGSFKGKLTDKTATEKDGTARWSTMGVSLTTTGYGATPEYYVGVHAKKDNDNNDIGSPLQTVHLESTNERASTNRTSDTISEKTAVDYWSTFGVTFQGTAPASSNSKATNANTTYYGAITVGLGKYKKWQGNYAVLKINSVTEKAVLRIYDV
jgi:hypothetical protein